MAGDLDISRRELGLAFAAGAVGVAVKPARSAPAKPLSMTVGRFEHALQPATSIAGDAPVRWTLAERMATWKVPGVSLAVMRGGRLAWAKGYGLQQVGGAAPIDVHTMFSVGSISKIGAAVVTLRLADTGKLDLDTDVNRYLRRWRVPENSFTAREPVTLRGLLSHSAGVTVSGFPDFQPGARLPTLVETLDGLPPAVVGPVRVDHTPGTEAIYSGGGVEIEQLVIEEQTGLSFPEAARTLVLEPLGMTRSTYAELQGFSNIAKAHDAKGQPTALPRGWESFAEQAASSLWTTPSDVARLLADLLSAWRGTGGLLSHRTALSMMTEVGPSLVGLGPFLDGDGATRRLFHLGSNDSYKAWVEMHLATGDGLVIMTNGANGVSLFPEIRRAIAEAEGWASAFNPSARLPKVAMERAQLAELVGTYWAADAPTPARQRAIMAVELAGYHVENDRPAFKVGLDEAGLTVSEANAAHPTRLIAEDPTHFVPADNADIVFEFTRDYHGQVFGLVARAHGQAMTALRAPS